MRHLRGGSFEEDTYKPEFDGPYGATRLTTHERLTDGIWHRRSVYQGVRLILTVDPTRWKPRP